MELIRTEESVLDDNLDMGEVEKIIRTIVTSETLDSLTSRKVREEIENQLNLLQGSLISKKLEINEIIDQIILEIQGDLEDHEPLTKKSMEYKTLDKYKQEYPTNNEGEVSSEQSDYAGNEEDSDKEIRQKRERGLEDDEENNDKSKSITKKSTKPKETSVMSIDEFLEKAQVLSLTINNSKTKLAAAPRQFSTGSVGWYYGNKVSLPVGDSDVICQLSLNCTVVGSKSWKRKSIKKRR
ncbi:uncharacterized protein CMU_028970 [Cryptosporidium muris RN66]|uniref:DEK-C domain-containing protein n=1 Tax=Cryptosporidium muris (strain RN66) TaxID=441375 RepID=B6AHY2_CRYMR|nr:uncharacterized protein CMU_028970 [Cryptosporidium muris RN66]EEA07823.1 hypothetical protein, conserved [Cryptosporidium muris RN66]|eukprot:XP_002142172.1 hypothetical protein [Cryptosporidium muris RN66]